MLFPKQVMWAVLTAGVFVSGSIAQDDVALPDLNTVISELENFRETQARNRERAMNETLATFRESARNRQAASRAFADAVRMVNFDGKPNAAARFQDWRRDKSDLLNSRNLQAAAQLHLQYLALTLGRIGTGDTPQTVSESIAYVRELGNARAEFGGDLGRPEEVRDLLNKPLHEGVFVRSVGLGQLIQNQGKDWELNPGNINGILEKNVRRVLREQKDPRLLETWDLQIEIEGRIAGDASGNVEGSAFAETGRPQLQWNKANDLVAIGQSGRGLSAMLSLIRAHPSHANINQWVDRAVALAREQQTAVSTPTPASE